jgi:hypothetical protein
MSTQEIVWQVPESLYRELVWAQEELAYPSLLDFIAQAVQRRLAEVHYQAWQREFRQLQQDVRATGGFGLGETKDEVIANLREIRQQIFEQEYAHLYR